MWVKGKATRQALSHLPLYPQPTIGDSWHISAWRALNMCLLVETPWRARSRSGGEKVLVARVHILDVRAEEEKVGRRSDESE